MVQRGPGHEGACDRLRIGMSVGLTFGENVPNRHQKFAGNRGYRFVLAKQKGARP